MNDFQAQLKVKDEEYVKALKQQAEDVEELLERMRTEFRELQVLCLRHAWWYCSCFSASGYVFGRRNMQSDAAAGGGFMLLGKWGSGRKDTCYTSTYG